MEFPAGRRRHPNTCRAEVVAPHRIPYGVERHRTEPPDCSDGVPDGKMMQVIPAESNSIQGAW